MRKRPGFWGLTALALMLVAAGCGKKRLVPVEGVVTLDGKPFEGAGVRFIPEGGSGHQANGHTGSDGAFSLTTFTTGDGAYPGDYKVVVAKSAAAPDTKLTKGTAGEDPSDNIKSMYGGFTKTKEFKSKGREGKSALPSSYSDESKTTLKARVPVDGKLELKLSSKGGS